MAVSTQRWIGYLKRLRKRRSLALAKRYASLPNRVWTQVGTVATQGHFRRPADCIVEESTGNLLWANGIDQMLRFTPYAQLVENAGTLKPTSALTMSATGVNGPIVGTFYAYTRFVDRDGQFSSLSTISAVFTPNTLVNPITGASNASPIVLTVNNSLTAGQTVLVSGVMGNSAANGTWTVAATPAPTSTTIALQTATGTNSIGSGTYNSGGNVYTGCVQIIYSNVPTPTEAKVVRRQILRNQDGEATVFYIDIDTTDLTSTTFTSNTPSLSLTGPVSLFDSAGNTLVDKTVPPSWKKYIAPYLGRMFAAGIRPYSEGAVSVTNGSTAVTGIGTEWQPLTFSGRSLQVVGGNGSYQILSCNSSTSLTLSTPYTGSTDAFSYYTILPNNPVPSANFNNDRRTFYWTPPGQPEAWPTTFQNTLDEDQGAGEITGLMPMGAFLFFLFDNRIRQFSYVNDPLADGYATISARRGCINNRCWVQTEAASLMMDTRGFHLFSGNDDAPLGTIEVQDLFRAQQQGPWKINWAAKENFHAVFDPGEAVVRWFVVLAGHYTPHHAICFQLRMRRWWIEEYPFPVGSSVLGRMNGKPQVFLGSDGRRIFALSRSVLDGLDPTTGTVHGTATSAGLNWLADTTATFPGSNVVGSFVTIVQGKGKYQRRRIVSVSGTTLNVDYPWTTALDTSSTYQIGGVSWYWFSGWHKWAPNRDKAIRAVNISYKPLGTQGAMYMQNFTDFSKTPDNWATSGTLADGNGITHQSSDPATDLAIDQTKANGWVWQRFDNFRDEYTDVPRYMAVELGGTTNLDAFTLRGLRLDGVS